MGPYMLDRVVTVLSKYFDNIPANIEMSRILTPLDIERTYGSTHGSPRHGDLTFARLWSAGAAKPWEAYRTAVPGLYLCGSGTWPGGTVTGASGYNAARALATLAGRPARQRTTSYGRVGG
ncbi:hypothetical protein JCM18899A_54600 [Nocardioides sp. AN3]